MSLTAAQRIAARPIAARPIPRIALTWLLVAQGYAVLLPDPALSTGYGEQFIARGWARWGTGRVVGSG